MNDWNIDTEKVVAVDTDNTRNMVNAICELDLFNFPCIAHTSPLGLKKTWSEKSFHMPKVHTTLAEVRRLVTGLRMSKLRK